MSVVGEDDMPENGQDKDSPVDDESQLNEDYPEDWSTRLRSSTRSSRERSLPPKETPHDTKSRVEQLPIEEESGETIFYTPESKVYCPETILDAPEPCTSSSSYPLLFGFVAVLAVLGGIFGSQHGWSFDDQLLSIEEQLERLKSSCPPQTEHTWNYIRYGLGKFENKTVVESKLHPPLVYLLIGEDQEVMDGLANAFVEQISKNVYGSPIKLSCDESNSENTILRFSDIFQDRKILMLTKLQNLPATVATELHYFCDTENPLVHNSFIIMTLQADSNEYTIINDNIKGIASRRLSSLWSSQLPDKILSPLISRLTQIVLDIKGAPL